MVRPVRPSDVFSLPDPDEPVASAAEPYPGPAEPGAPAPERRRALWPLAVAVLAVGLVATGVAGGAVVPEERVVPVVTAVDKQHAVLALALYQAEAGVAEELAQRRKDPRPGNPRRLHAAAAAGVATVESALRRARAVSGADPLATAYTDDPGHARLLDVLAALGRVEPEAPSAERERARLLAAVTTPALDRLRAYLLGLPADLLAGLRDHPSAGPALRAIEHAQRQVTAR